MKSRCVDNRFGKQRMVRVRQRRLDVKRSHKIFMTGRVSRSDSKSRPLSKLFIFHLDSKNDLIQNNNTATLVAVAGGSLNPKQHCDLGRYAC